MAMFAKKTPTQAGGEIKDMQSLRRQHAAIEKECRVLAEATAERRAAVQRLKAESAAAHAAAQDAQRAYAIAMATSPTSTPPAPGQALAHALGLDAALVIAEDLVRDAEAAEAPVRARLADAQDALDHGEWRAAEAEFAAAIEPLMPVLARLRSATHRARAPWYMPELRDYLRRWEHAQGIDEPWHKR